MKLIKHLKHLSGEICIILGIIFSFNPINSNISTYLCVLFLTIGLILLFLQDYLWYNKNKDNL